MRERRRWSTMARHILAYHAISDGWELSAATVKTRRFREQCAALAALGYAGTRLDAAAFGSDDYRFALTVDDGYESLLSVIVPECARYGWTGTAFVATHLVGSDGSWDRGAWRKHRHLDWLALRDVVAQGWEIGAHGTSHRALTDMLADEAERELRQAREEIEQNLGVAVSSLAYPFGATSRGIVELARGAGYTFGVTMRPGPVSQTTDPLLLPRWPVYRMDRSDHIVVRLAGPRWTRALEWAKVWTIQSYARGTRARMKGVRYR